MSDWLGMLTEPRTPRPELKARVLARAMTRPRRWPLAAAAILVAGAGAGGWWVYRTIGGLEAERDRLATRVEALEDTVASFIRGAGTQLLQIPVSTGGRVGAVTIFADSVRHRWLVRCDGLAPNARDQAYQLWFITEAGMETAAVMPMNDDRPMVMALDMPRVGGRVMGAAMSIEPRGGSPSPSGPMVFHRML